jgi:putative oxidoreductase
MLSILRIIVGLLYMEHGLAKILGFPLQPNHAPYALFNLNPGLQGLLELLGGLLLALGLFTRTVAFILAGDMAVAYFMAHAPRGFFPLLNGGELAIVYCFVFLYFWVAGGGEWSLDRIRAPASAPAASPSRAWAIIGYVMPFFGLELLDIARDVAAFNLPARVGQLFGVSL